MRAELESLKRHVTWDRKRKTKSFSLLTTFGRRDRRTECNLELLTE